MSRLIVEKSFLEQALDLPKDVRLKIFKCLQYLIKDTDHPGLQTKKIKGSKSGAYECRIDRNIRMIYGRDGEYLICKYIGYHDDAINMGIHMVVDDIVIVNKSLNKSVVENEVELKNQYTIDELKLLLFW